MRTTLAAVLRVLAFVPSIAASMAACTLTADPPSQPQADPLGNGLRLAQIQDPKSPDYKVNQSATVTSAVCTWLDTYDETMDGKSKGTLYVQDIGSNAPYAGIDIYEANYVPASLTVLPGDVLDLVGPYQETTKIGNTGFDTGTFLPQLYKPVGTFRYQYPLPATPKVLTAADLWGSDEYFPTARQWMNMLVTLNDVVLATGVDLNKRVTYAMGDVGAKPGSMGAISSAYSVAMSNELFALGATDYQPGTHLKSLTGIVTWFFGFQVAPRTRDDIVVDQ
jgi:hypothetical protein